MLRTMLVAIAAVWIGTRRSRRRPRTNTARMREPARHRRIARHRGGRYGRAALRRAVQPQQPAQRRRSGPHLRRWAAASPTQQVLAALAAHCTKATFFMVGRQAMADPEWPRRSPPGAHDRHPHLVASQHEHHTPARAGRDRPRLQRRAGAVGAPIAPFFRFPYLVQDETMLAHLRAQPGGLLDRHRSVRLPARAILTRRPRHPRQGCVAARRASSCSMMCSPRPRVRSRRCSTNCMRAASASCTWSQGNGRDRRCSTMRSWPSR